MAERPSWATMDDTSGVVDAEDARITLGMLLLPSATITSRGGFRPSSGDPGRVRASSTPDTQVHTEEFALALPPERGTGSYFCVLDAEKDTDILGDHPADSTDDRHDLIVVQQSDTYYGDAETKLLVRHVVGTPSSDPQDPDVDGSPDYIRLARVLVQADATEITDSDITDLRSEDTGETVALGGTLPVNDDVERDEIANPYTGLGVYRKDLQAIEFWNGSEYRPPHRPPQVEVFEGTSSDESYTWNKPAGVTYVLVEIAGGGGGGAGAASTGDGEYSSGSGGGAGGYSRKIIPAADLGSSESVQSGGYGFGSGFSDGGDGGVTEFGTHCSANGGEGGTESLGTGSSGASGGQGGTATGGDVNIEGQDGGARYRNGGAGIVWGGGGGSNQLGVGDDPGPKSPGSTYFLGDNGNGYGSGGGGAANQPNQDSHAGGDGAPGVVFVTSFF
ncbi:hypothetical protein SAMN06265360_10616 [Haloechinothrix alba]|uniref:Glycine-rich domain-containing protein n=1 Tax=Haloechinothrix alba TaxID=664784 RepID=A0A238WBU5_9PSEU|nr:hypothetical protein [Haloechinothrix alba]SNR44032.1 hypothetical protein SAMN06265360_10616 [Haloechinothrix alba]